MIWYLCYMSLAAVITFIVYRIAVQEHARRPDRIQSYVLWILLLVDVYAIVFASMGHCLMVIVIFLYIFDKRITININY